MIMIKMSNMVDVYFVFLLFAIVVPVQQVLGKNNQKNYNLRLYNGWKAVEVITVGDSVESGWDLPDDMDGLGAYVLPSDHNCLRLLANHEKTSGATISEIDLYIPNLMEVIQNTLQQPVEGLSSSGQQQDITTVTTNVDIEFVINANQAFDRYSLEIEPLNYQFSSNAKEDADFSRFCSGQTFQPNTFGYNRGFVDHIYVTGEETFDTDGRFFALDLVERHIYQLSRDSTGCPPGSVMNGDNVDPTNANPGNCGMPYDSFENGALVDTRETDHVALLLSCDGGSETLQLYIGHKNHDRFCQPIDSNQANVLERNGLACGSYHYLTGDFPSTEGEVFWDGSFATVNPNKNNDKGNKKNKNNDVESDLLSSGKLEDVDTSPVHPTKVVLADETSGIFVFDFDLQFDSEGKFDPETSYFTLTMLVDEQGCSSGILTDGDNVEWTGSTRLGGQDYPEGIIFLNEDSDNGEIWMMNPDGTGHTLVAKSDVDDSDTTGIIDISEYVNYRPASILLVSVWETLSILIHPDATMLESEPECLDLFEDCTTNNDGCCQPFICTHVLAPGVPAPGGGAQQVGEEEHNIMTCNPPSNGQRPNVNPGDRGGANGDAKNGN